MTSCRLVGLHIKCGLMGAWLTMCGNLGTSHTGCMSGAGTEQLDAPDGMAQQQYVLPLPLQDQRGHIVRVVVRGVLTGCGRRFGPKCCHPPHEVGCIALACELMEAKTFNTSSSMFSCRHSSWLGPGDTEKWSNTCSTFGWRNLGTLRCAAKGSSDSWAQASS